MKLGCNVTYYLNVCFVNFLKFYKQKTRLLVLLLQIQPDHGTIHTVVKFVSLEAALLTRVWWRCTAMDSGELCVQALRWAV